jgi:catechol 2,3-dioxygenase-like lactoylglutathione lyase family enzyme
MIERRRVSSIWSADLDNFRPFYRDVPGLPVGLETPRRLADAGVDLLEGSKDLGDVRVATFNDPDGNTLQLLESHG